MHVHACTCTCMHVQFLHFKSQRKLLSILRLDILSVVAIQIKRIVFFFKIYLIAQLRRTFLYQNMELYCLIYFDFLKEEK